MLQKNNKEQNFLNLDSRVKSIKLKQQRFVSPNRLTNAINSKAREIDCSNSAASKTIGFNLSQQSSGQGKISYYSSPNAYKKYSSNQSEVEFSSQIKRLREQRDLLKKNIVHQIEYYVRQRLKDLTIIQQFILANQYQRAQKYIENQLALLRKRHENFLLEDTCCKPTLTRDISIGSNIEDDSIYNELIKNIINNLKQIEIGSNFILPIIKKLSNENQISTKKLAWYFQQDPFQMTSQQSRTSLSVKLISQLGYNSGRKILQVIAKSVQQTSKGDILLKIQQQPTKSQMSRLIQQHSISKLRKQKKLKQLSQ